MAGGNEIAAGAGLRCRRDGTAGTWVGLAAAFLTAAGAGSGARAAEAAADDCRLTPIGRHTVAAIVDAETIRIDDGGEVRLADIRPPRASDVAAATGDGAVAASFVWPREQALLDELGRMLVGRTIVLATDGRPGARLKDRYGRQSAHVLIGNPPESALTAHSDNAGWLQATLLRDGLARLAFGPGDAPCLNRLVEYERSARQASRGLWQEAAYETLRATDRRSLFARTGTLQTVEGVVARIGTTRARVYLDFGELRSRDLSVVMRRSVANMARGGGLDPAELAHRRVRVTGWLQWRGGPVIEITHPAQVELADNPSGNSQENLPEK